MTSGHPTFHQMLIKVRFFWSWVKFLKEIGWTSFAWTKSMNRRHETRKKSGNFSVLETKFVKKKFKAFAGICVTLLETQESMPGVMLLWGGTAFYKNFLEIFVERMRYKRRGRNTLSSPWIPARSTKHFDFI